MKQDGVYLYLAQILCFYIFNCANKLIMKYVHVHVIEKQNIYFVNSVIMIRKNKELEFRYFTNLSKIHYQFKESAQTMTGNVTGQRRIFNLKQSQFCTNLLLCQGHVTPPCWLPLEHAGKKFRKRWFKLLRKKIALLIKL